MGHLQFRDPKQYIRFGATMAAPTGTQHRRTWLGWLDCSALNIPEGGASIPPSGGTSLRPVWFIKIDMAVVDARVRVHHPCPYCDVSVEFPQSLLLLWCDNLRDVFLVSSPTSSESEKLVRTLHRSFRARPLLRDGTDALLSIPDFSWSYPPSVTGLARKTRVWVIHPVIYFDGTETYRFVAPSKKELQKLVLRLRRLGDVELLAVSNRVNLSTIRDMPTATVHFFEGLTRRQAQVLTAAFEGGLLDVPARATWGDVARRVGLSRSTFGEHLRKGQLRLLANNYASLKAQTRVVDRPVLLPALSTGGRRNVQAESVSHDTGPSRR